MRRARIVWPPARVPIDERGSGMTYPNELEQTIRLRSGAPVTIRPIRADDEMRLRELYDRLSFDTTVKRFFTRMPSLSAAQARFLANVDYRDRLALVAETQALIAVARYDRLPIDGVAEIALVVEDAWQGLGLGTILLHELMSAAHLRGIRSFRADVLTDNRRMLRFLADRTDVLTRNTQHGVTEVVFRRRDDGATGEERSMQSA